MLFFSVPAALPDPAGLILSAAEATRDRALRRIRKRAAAVTAARILARARQDRRNRR